MSKSRQKGTAWESRLVAYFRAHGWPDAERRSLEGKNDRGDIAGIKAGGRSVVIEAKNCKQMDLAGWIDEMVKEKANDGAEIGAVVFPRRNHAIGRAYVLHELDEYTEMLRLLSYYAEMIG